MKEIPSHKQWAVMSDTQFSAGIQGNFRVAESDSTHTKRTLLELWLNMQKASQNFLHHNATISKCVSFHSIKQTCTLLWIKKQKVWGEGISWKEL
jgi:hypothetical protein